MQRIAIIGFGFCGNLLLANLVRQASKPCEIYLIDPTLNGRGMAYGTTYDAHLLNVRAANMSAWTDTPDDFARWLKKNHPNYGSQDFAPRRIYGEYLESIWQGTQKLTAKKKLMHKLIPAIAVAITRHSDHYAILTDRGDAIAADRIVLATGNEIKPALGPKDVPMVQAPWVPGALAKAAKSPGPLLLIGSGLTAVDMVLALREEGYGGDIIGYSRNGLLPHPHTNYGATPTIAPSEIEPLRKLQHWARWLRQKTRDTQDWRPVIDGLRPFTQASWQKLRTRQQKLFFRRVFSFWNVHRHRMAPEIDARLQAQMKQGSLRILNRRQWRRETIVPSLAINCTGAELNVEKSAQPLLKNLLAQRLIEPHASGVGIATDAHHRAWGEAYPNLYAMGALMTGQLLESTAVPELRVQAHTIAEALCK